MDEKLFWQTMNPARLHALYDAALLRGESVQPQEQPRRSLSEYLTSGG